MGDLPPPDATLDVRTGYGVVRFYRFDGASPELGPLVLLPGRASASPVWADNLPSLRSLRTVYTVDLLGEPGASVQDRPIENDDDQARWLHQGDRRSFRFPQFTNAPRQAHSGSVHLAAHPPPPHTPPPIVSA